VTAPSKQADFQWKEELFAGGLMQFFLRRP
jgi:hypothetical protein